MFSSKLVEKVTGKHPILSAPTAGTKPSSLLKSPLAGTGCRDYCHPSPRSKEWRQLLSNRPGDNATLLLLGRAMGQSASLQHSLGWSHQFHPPMELGREWKPRGVSRGLAASLPRSSVLDGSTSCYLLSHQRLSPWYIFFGVFTLSAFLSSTG